MAIGTWNNSSHAIDITMTGTDGRQLLVVMMFSRSWRKQFDILRVSGAAEELLMRRDNCDSERLLFTALLPAGTYRIYPAFGMNGCDGPPPSRTDIAPTIIPGNDPQGETIIELFEWNFGKTEDDENPNSEKAAVTLVLVDNEVGRSGESPVPDQE